MTSDDQLRSQRGRARQPDVESIGARIRKLRMQSGLPQGDIAERAGVTVGTMSRYETNDATPPDRVIERLSKFFKVSQAYLRYGRAASWFAPVIGVVGTDGAVFALDLPADRVEVPPMWTDVMAYRIISEDNAPTYHAGGAIVVQGEPRLQFEEILGRMCLVTLDGGASFVRDVQRTSTRGHYDLATPSGRLEHDRQLISARPVIAYFSAL